MTGPWGNSQFCFPETLGEVELNQNSLFPAGPVIKCFFYAFQLKNRKTNSKKSFAWRRLANNFAQFQGARADHVRVQSLSCCFPRELVSFLPLGRSVSFDPRHVTLSPPIGKCICVRRYTKYIWFENLRMVVGYCLIKCALTLVSRNAKWTLHSKILLVYHLSWAVPNHGIGIPAF